MDKNGNLREPCGDEKTEFEAKAVGKCPKVSFFDIGNWSCWSCPEDQRLCDLARFRTRPQIGGPNLPDVQPLDGTLRLAD